jgi:hypothetical protein
MECGAFLEKLSFITFHRSYGSCSCGVQIIYMYSYLQRFCYSILLSLILLLSEILISRKHLVN